MIRQSIPLEDRLILALDVPTPDEALAWVNRLRDKIRFFKIGLQLFVNSHFRVVDIVNDCGAGVFLDLKLYDIPNTVRNAIEQVNNRGVRFVTVHGESGIIKAAVGAAEGVKILAVTVLTSMDEDDLRVLGSTRNIEEIAALRAQLARDAGCHGIVASGREVAKIRRIVGDEMIIVTPGIRPAGYGGRDDQKRVVTPGDAIRSGADYIVVGRPILKSPDPEKVVDEIFDEIRDNLP